LRNYELTLTNVSQF